LIKLFFAASDENDNAEQNNYGYYYNRYNNSCTHISCSLLGMLVFYLIFILYNANVYELSEKCLRNINMKVFRCQTFGFFQHGDSIFPRGTRAYERSAQAFENGIIDGIANFRIRLVTGAEPSGLFGDILAAFSFLLSICHPLWYFPRFKTFKIKAKMLRVKLKDTIAILKLGTSNFINHSIMMLVNIVMNNTLTHYGALTVYGSDIPLAVSGVVAKLNSIMSAFCVGLAQGCQPIHSFNMGAKNYARIKETYKKALAIALIISILGFLSFQTFPRQIISNFGSGDELYFEFAERYLRIFMMMICVYGVQPLTVNYFTGIGDAKRGIVLSLSRQGFFLIPLLIVLPIILGLDGVLYSGPIADALACTLSLLLVARSFKRLTALQQAEPDTIEP